MSGFRASKSFGRRSGGVAAGVAALSLCAATMPVQAQIEEVVVTAQKRTETLQSVPISVTALTANALESYGLDRTPLDLDMATPGLQTTQVVQAFEPRIRGIGTTDATPANESAVSVYVDGVYIPGPASGMLSLANIQRVEVLKGPQGTLFGRNTTGGLIQVITKDPSQETGGTFSLSYDNFDTSLVNGYVTTGITDNVAIDFAGRWQYQGDGWGKNLYDGKDVFRQRNETFRSKLLATPTERLTITLAGDYYHYNDDFSAFRKEVPNSFYDIDQDLDPEFHGHVWGTSLHLNYEFDFATFTSISAYRNLNQDSNGDFDFSTAFIQHTYFDSWGKSVSQEFNLAAPSSSDIQWIVGFFYLDKKNAVEPAGQEGALLALAFSPPLSNYELYNKQKTNSYAGYAQMTYPLPFDTNLTLGARYTRDEQDFKGYNKLYPLSGGPVVVTDKTKDDLDNDKWTYRIAVDHNFTDEIMAYASFNTGFKSGYFSIVGSPAGSADPETVDAYEVGMKSQWLDNRLRVNLAAYYYDFKDVQTLFLLSGAAITVNAGDAKIRGFELDMKAAPLENLNLSFGANWMPKAKYGNFAPCPGPQTPPWAWPPFSASYDCSNSDMINAPEWDISLAAQYTVPTEYGDIDFSVIYQYQDKFAWDADFGIVENAFGTGEIYNPKGVYEEPSRNLVNATAKWTSPSLRYNVSIWGRNLTDVQYLVNGTQASGNGQIGMPGEPRTYGVTVGYDF